MSFISDASIKEVMSRTDVVQVVGEYVGLKRAGVRFKGLCPFHNEKTPSFTVNQEQGFFHCFGCGEHGDAIGFLQKHNGVTFVEAVEHLASLAGVELKYEGGQSNAPRKSAEQRDIEKRQRQAQFDLTNWASRFFQTQLQNAPRNSPVWRYIEERGLKQDTLSTFGVGLAPDDWAAMAVALQKDGRDSRTAEALGLIVPRKSGQGHYDRFRNRLMFPVFDIAEKPIAFGGRILPGDGEKETAKYINSPDSPIYTKGNILFGLAQAKKAIRKEGYAVIVEGNIDVLMLHQEGFQTTVAPMGTALTPEQVRLLRRFTEEVVLLYDGDVAGRAAALKSLPMLLDADIHGKIIVLDDKDDPDTFVRTHGAEALANRIKNARPVMEFLIDQIVEQHGMTDRGRAKALAELQPYIQAIKDFRERQLVTARVAATLDLPERRVIGMLRSRSVSEVVPTQEEEIARPILRDMPAREEKLTMVCLQHPSCLSWLEDVDGQTLVEHEGLRRVLWEAITAFGEQGVLEPTTLLERIDDQALKNWVAGAFCSESEVEEENAHQFVEDCYKLMQADANRRRSRALMSQIEAAQQMGDLDTVQTLLAEKMLLDRERTGVGAALKTGGKK